MADSIAGTYATLAGIEIVNDARTFSYLKNGLGPGSINVYGDCSCPNLLELLNCTAVHSFTTIDGLGLTGASGSYASTPDGVPLSVTTDLQLDAKVAPLDLTPAVAMSVIAKWESAGNQRSYTLQINTSGGLTLSWSANGTTIITRDSTAALPFSDGTTFYIRASLDVDNGAAGHDVKFWFSTLGDEYTQLGSTVTTAGVTAVFDSTVPVELGSQDGGTNNLFIGVIYSAQIRNGISPNGFNVGSPDFQPEDPEITPADTFVVDEQNNTWTRHGTATFLPGTGTTELPASYASPSSDAAPWYSTDIPESADFLGFIVNEFEGMSSTFERKVVESVGHGGVLSRSRLGTRSMSWRGFLFGATCCSVQYGLRWLTKTLSQFGSMNCRDCAGDDLELLVCCPGSEETAGGSPFRLLKGVGLLDGPEILSERKTCTSACSSGCGGSCVLEVEFTLVASQPYFYSPPIPVYDCVPLFEGSVAPYTQATIDCGPTDCSDFIFEEGGVCVLPELPPTASYSSSCVELFNDPVANYYTVPRTAWSDNEEVVPVISISSGPLPVHQLKLGFYSSTSGNPCGDLSLYPPDCDVVCDELTILAIPANSTFYIDGRTRKMALICSDGSVFPAERLTSGPWSWPTFDCYGFCLEVVFDTLGVNAAEKAACVSVSLVPRTF